MLSGFQAAQKTEHGAAKPALPLKNIKRVCYVGGYGEHVPRPVSEERIGLEEAIGGRRGLEADLAVVDDLSRLHDCPDDASFPQVLAIVARGLPVITSASWKLALGDPESVPKESVLRHRPLAMERKFRFNFSVQFS